MKQPQKEKENTKSINYAQLDYKPLKKYPDEGRTPPNLVSPRKIKEAERKLKDKLVGDEDFDSLIDIHNYEVIVQKHQNAKYYQFDCQQAKKKLDMAMNSQEFSTQTSHSSLECAKAIRELELRCHDYKKRLNGVEMELNKQDRKIEEFQEKESKYLQNIYEGKQMESLQHIDDKLDSQRLNSQESEQGTVPKIKDEMLEKQKEQIKQVQAQLACSIQKEIKNESTMPLEKLFQFENTIKKFELLLAKKDLEISSLMSTVQQMQGTVEFQVQQKMKEREKSSQHDQSMTQLPFMAENWDLKRMNANLRTEVLDLKKKLKLAVETAEASTKKEQLLSNKIKEYIATEKEKQEADPSKQDIIKVAEDRGLLDGIVGILQYVREALCEVMFEMFVRSGNIAYERKANSLAIFSVNIKEMFGYESRGFVIPLYMYKKMRQLIKIYYPDYGKTATLDSEMYKIILGEKGLGVEKKEANSWILKTIEQIQSSSATEKNQDQEEKDLYRYLAILYRTRYPLSGVDIQIDLDIQIKLQDRIVDSMLKVSIDENQQDDDETNQDDFDFD